MLQSFAVAIRKVLAQVAVVYAINYSPTTIQKIVPKVFLKHTFSMLERLPAAKLFLKIIIVV